MLRVAKDEKAMLGTREGHGDTIGRFEEPNARNRIASDEGQNDDI